MNRSDSHLRGVTIKTWTTCALLILIAIPVTCAAGAKDLSPEMRADLLKQIDTPGATAEYSHRRRKPKGKFDKAFRSRCEAAGKRYFVEERWYKPGLYWSVCIPK